ncbi:hypothetical protein ACOKM5_20685 [Streptomyces sp. BH097]|uniref:hypothetical protein n=1 Tax=Streptomyces sp. BH097 TaxID=3410406 RepID=UPI003CE9DAED
MATSAVPGAITALLEILRAAPGMTGVDVVDGPPLGDQADQDLVAVGWSPNGDQAVEIAQNFNAAGARSRDEDFSITGWIDSWAGDLEVAVVRARVFELFGVIEQAVRASGPNPTAPTLNGAVLWAHLTRGLLRQALTEQGVKASLEFTVSCRARI